MRLAIQLYTLRDVDDTLTETLYRVAKTPYEGVQFSGPGDQPTTDLLPVLKETGLDVADAHVRLEHLEDEYDETIETYRTLGCERLVVPSYEQEAFNTNAGAEEAGRRLADLADKVTQDGFELHYHNHTFEFTRFKEQTAFDVFVDAADGVGLEIDTGLANSGGADPVALMERYGDRVDLVHLTDSDPNSWEKRHSDLGTGTVDLEACVTTARDIGAEWIIFEHGLTDDPVTSMNKAIETIGPMLE